MELQPRTEALAGNLAQSTDRPITRRKDREAVCKIRVVIIPVRRRQLLHPVTPEWPASPSLNLGVYRGIETYCIIIDLWVPMLAFLCKL